MLNIQMLGPFLVEVDDEPVANASWKTQKNKSLCKILLTYRHHTLSRERLIEWLWPNLPPDRADRSLRVAISQLRRVLEPALPRRAPSSYILSTDAGYAWNLDSAYQLDAETFEMNCASLLRPITDDGQDGARLHRHQVGQETVALYQDDFLTEDRYAEWSLVERERLRELYLTLLTKLADWQMDEEMYGAAIESYRSILTRDNCRETVWRGLMRAYALAGDRAQALNAFAECTRALAQELEMEPSVETVRLFENLRGTGNVPGPAPSAQSNLPAPLTEFVGREDELQTLIQSLQDGHPRLVTILGPGGVGKTRLALEAARRVGEGERVLYLPMSSLTTAEQMVAALADLLGLQATETQRAIEAVGMALAEQQCLLVLDGCEHLPQAGTIIEQLLGAGPATRALVTSQVRLNTLSERVFPLAGMSADSASQPNGAGQEGATRPSDAETLFLTVARRVEPGFKAGEKDLADIRQICALLDGLPLAIELVATWVRALSPEELISELQNNLDFLHGEDGDRPARHRSLRAAFDYSWQLLPRRDQALAARLAIFCSSFDRHAAQQVADAMLSDLVRLSDRSLALAEGHGRFRLHAQVRHFALEMLRSAGVEGTLQQRHGQFFLGWLAGQRDALRVSGQPKTTDAIRQVLADVRAAWSWASDTEQWGLLVGATEPLYRFCDATGRFLEGIHLFQEAIDKIVCAEEAVSPAEDRRLPHGILLSCLGGLAHRIGDYALAETTLAACLPLLADGPPASRSFALNQMGMVVFLQGKTTDADGYFQQSLALCRQADDVYGAAVTLNYLGLWATATGDYSQALLYYDESMRLKSALGDERGIAATLVNLGTVLRGMGNDFEAQQFLYQALEAYRHQGYSRGEAMASVELARVARLIGEAEEANRHTRHSLALALEINTLPVALEALTEAGMNLIEAGQLVEGMTLLLFVQAHPAASASTRKTLSTTLQRLGHHQPYTIALHEAEVLLHQSPTPPTLRGLASHYLAQDRTLSVGSN